MSFGPFISVVIPTFDRARQVRAALESVLMQTYKEFEVIVIDDGSTDGTREVIQEIIDKQRCGDPQIRYFFQPNQGQSSARNRGINEAGGEWVAFLDSDDRWLPEKLEWQIRAINQFEVECCACITDARLVDNFGMDGTVFSESGIDYEKTCGIYPDAAETLVKSREQFWMSTLLVRADVAKQIGWFDSELHYAEDHDFLFRLSLTTHFCYLNKPLSLLDRSKSPEGSKCRPWDRVEVRLQGTQAMLEKWLKFDSKLSAELRKTVVESLRHVHSAWANWYLEHGRYEEARKAVREAAKRELTAKLAIKLTLTHVAPGFVRRISPKMRVG